MNEKAMINSFRYEREQPQKTNSTVLLVYSLQSHLPFNPILLSRCLFLLKPYISVSSALPSPSPKPLSLNFVTAHLASLLPATHFHPLQNISHYLRLAGEALKHHKQQIHLPTTGSLLMSSVVNSASYSDSCAPVLLASTTSSTSLRTAAITSASSINLYMHQ